VTRASRREQVKSLFKVAKDTPQKKRANERANIELTIHCDQIEQQMQIW